MSRIVIVAVALALSAPAVAATAQPQERGMGGVVGITVYEDRDFRGRNANFRQDVPDLRQSGMNDRIVSLQVANGEAWEVCEHAFYGGRCQVFYGVEYDLRQRGWARTISSMRRVRGNGGGGGSGWGGGGGGGGWGGGGGADRGLVLYSGRNFGGQTRILAGPTRDLRDLSFNDMAESLRVPRGEEWEVCDNIEFDRCRVVTGEVTDLNRIGLRRKISSARPLRGGGGGGWGGGGGGGYYPPPGPGPRPPGAGYGRIILFEGMNFSGRSSVLTSPSSSVNMTYVNSVRVEAGNWELCESDGFRGRCTTVNVDVSNLRSMGLPGRVRSARPVASPR